MIDNLTAGAGVGGGGILGIIMAWLGFRTKICAMEKRLDFLAKDVQYERTCNEIHKAIDQRLENIEEMQRETREDIKSILEKMG